MLQGYFEFNKRGSEILGIPDTEYYGLLNDCRFILSFSRSHHSEGFVCGACVESWGHSSGPTPLPSELPVQWGRWIGPNTGHCFRVVTDGIGGPREGF